jgi:hypothetical protein
MTMAMPLAALSSLAATIGRASTSGDLAAMWRCKLQLEAPQDAALAAKVHGSSGIWISSDASQTTEPKWTAQGHLDGTVHVAPDAAFPVTNSGDLDRPRLQWQIHGLNVAAEINWTSAGQGAGKIRLTATPSPEVRGQGAFRWNVLSFSMLGDCVRCRAPKSNSNRG